MMHIISINRSQGTAYTAYYAEHKPKCHLGGRVTWPLPDCSCPEWATNIDVPLDEVEAVTGTLPDGFQDPWPEIKDVSGRVEYRYDDNDRIVGVSLLRRFIRV
jgi:hypothetical protein